MDIVTVITLHRVCDDEIYTQVVCGRLDDEQREEWRRTYSCDEYSIGNTALGEDGNVMYFRELLIKQGRGNHGLINVDGEGYPHPVSDEADVPVFAATVFSDTARWENISV